MPSSTGATQNPFGLDLQQLDEWSVVDQISRGSKDTFARTARSLFLGFEALVDACRAESGRASVDAVSSRVMREIGAVAPNIPLLIIALAEHRGALRASLMAEYGLRLDDVAAWPAREVADLVAWLPTGCALWRDMGGPASLSEETRMLRAVEFGLRVLDWRMRQGKGQRPKPLPDPLYAHERRAAEQKQRRKADAFLRRQNRT